MWIQRNAAGDERTEWASMEGLFALLSSATASRMLRIETLGYLCQGVMGPERSSCLPADTKCYFTSCEQLRKTNSNSKNVLADTEHRSTFPPAGQTHNAVCAFVCWQVLRGRTVRSTSMTVEATGVRTAPSASTASRSTRASAAPSGQVSERAVRPSAPAACSVRGVRCERPHRANDTKLRCCVRWE